MKACDDFAAECRHQPAGFNVGKHDFTRLDEARQESQVCVHLLIRDLAPDSQAVDDRHASRDRRNEPGDRARQQSDHEQDAHAVGHLRVRGVKSRLHPCELMTDQDLRENHDERDIPTVGVLAAEIAQAIDQDERCNMTKNRPLPRLAKRAQHQR